MNISIQLVSKVSEYLSRKITLHELESWIIPRLPILLQEPETEVGELTAAVELCVFELQAGVRSERSIRNELGNRLLPVDRRVFWFSLQNKPRGDNNTGNTAAAPQIMKELRIDDQLPTWSTRLEVVCV